MRRGRAAVSGGVASNNSAEVFDRLLHALGVVSPFLLMMVSGWVYRHQLIVIEFLQAENQLLKARLCGKHIRFTDAERALLAKKAKAVGRKTLLQLDTVVSPDKWMRWHRRLLAVGWIYADRRGPGAARHHARD